MKNNDLSEIELVLYESMTAYFKGEIPILEIVDYEPLAERPDWLADNI
ncbi:hypothetical protein GF312_10860 [Candidatus Poribacteria bacterium]|nr:hypothetical protein [Candidatus Poribacteria bacterium]